MRATWPSLRLETRRAVRAGGLLMGAGVVAGVGNLVFNVVIARGGGAASYGVIGALLMLATIAGFLATGSLYAVAHLAAVGTPNRRGLMLPAFRGVAPWLVVSLVLVVGAVPLASYWHLASVAPVLLAAALLAVIVLGAAPTGLLVGFSRFRAVAGIGVGTTFLRLVLGAWLGRGPATVTGALVASVVPVALGALVGVVLVWRAGRALQPVESEVARGVSATAGAGLVVRGAIGALIAGGLWAAWTLPVLVARHLLDPTRAGEFAAAELLASGVIYATTPLVTAFYPTLARGGDRQAVVVGLLATASLAGLGVIGLAVVGPALMPRLYGSAFHPPASLLAGLGTSAAVITIAGFICWAAVARRRPMGSVMVWLGVGMLTDVLLCMAWAHSAIQLGFSPAIALSIGGLVAGVAWLAAHRRGVRLLGAVHASERSEVERCGS
jgi:O-antigen/teichoic acid export membrane protein